MSKSSLLDKTIDFTSSILEEMMKSGTRHEISDEATKDKSDSYNVETMGMSKAFVSDKTTESALIVHKEKYNKPLQPESRALFGTRLLDMIGFSSSKGENSGRSGHLRTAGSSKYY